MNTQKKLNHTYMSKIVFRSSKDIDKNPNKYLWGDIKEIMISEETE